MSQKWTMTLGIAMKGKYSLVAELDVNGGVQGEQGGGDGVHGHHAAQGVSKGKGGSNRSQASTYLMFQQGSKTRVFFEAVRDQDCTCKAQPASQVPIEEQHSRVLGVEELNEHAQVAKDDQEELEGDDPPVQGEVGTCRKIGARGKLSGKEWLLGYNDRRGLLQACA